MENIILGYEVGEICNRDGCKGTIEEEERRPCYCHAGNPPCSACTDPRVYCEECGNELPYGWTSEYCEVCMNNLAASILMTDDFGIDLDDFAC